MGDKVKPWHNRKPKKHESRGKRPHPLRPSEDKRIVGLRTREDYENDTYGEWVTEDREEDLEN